MIIFPYALYARRLPATFGGAELIPNCNLWLEISCYYAKIVVLWVFCADF